MAEKRGSVSFASEAVAAEGTEAVSETPVKIRRPTIIKAEGNPFLQKAASPEPSQKKIESLASCRRITHAELLDLIDVLEHIQDNPSRLTLLEHQKQPYLFASADLLELLTITESVKTRIAMIESIGPRLTDPTAKVGDFLNLFRYVEEKNHVEEALKSRAHQLAATQFSAGPSQKLMTGGRGGRGGAGVPSSPMTGPLGGRGGRGGRGGGGGGHASTDTISEPAVPPPAIESPPSTPIATKQATPEAQPEPGVQSEPEPEPEPEQTTPKMEMRTPSPVQLAADPVTDSPRLSISSHRPSFRLSVINPDTELGETIDSIPSEMEEVEAREYVMTPDTADVSLLQDVVPRKSPEAQIQKAPSPIQDTPSPAFTRRTSIRQSLSDPAERERNSDRLSERLSKVEIAVVLAALNMAENEVKEKETHLEEWEMAVVDEMTAEAEHRASMSAGSGIMRRLSNMLGFGAGDSESTKSATRGSISSSESIAEGRVVFGSTASMPDSAQYGVSDSMTQTRSASQKFSASSSSSSSSSSSTPSSPTEGNPGMPTPVRRNSSKIFSPTRPSPSKHQSWFSFKGVTSMFTPERQSQDFKYASALAYSLNMDRNAFLAMDPETSIEDDDEGNPLYSYKELLRRQYTKMYLGLPIECLEKYLAEAEFNFHFGMDKEKFYAQPKWKQIAQKKALMLF